MKNHLKSNSNNFRHTIIRSGALLISNIILYSYTAQAQNDGPSLDNARKSVKAIGEQMSNEEKYSYLGMVVGFILVMTVAWVSTVSAKKRRIAKEEMIRRRHLNNTVKHSSHDPYYKHHGHAVAHS